MAYTTNPNSGSLFKNDRRDKDSQPHAKGKALISGQWFWVSAWTKDTRDGGKYQSLSFEEMTPEQVAKYGDAGEAPQQRQQPARQPASGTNGGFRGNRPAPQRTPAERPYGDEKHFAESDVPF